MPDDAVDVLGTRLSTTSYERLYEELSHPPTGGRARTVAFCNVHSVMVARGDDVLAGALDRFDITATDGMPLVWMARQLGHPEQARVYGPDFTELALDRSQAPGSGWRHYFYGASPETLDALVTRVKEQTPGAEIVGWCSPPFRTLTAEEEDAHLADIRSSGATHVWIGLGMPRQELFCDRVADRLPGTTLLAVGAAFDFLAGTVSQAPDWLQERGLEWAYRFAQEPRRLASRYLVNNPLFVVLALAQVLRHRLTGRAGGGAR